MSGPTNFVAYETVDLSKATRLASTINACGRYEAVVRPVGDFFRVVLPGQCVEDTEAFMMGFVECFAAMYRA